MSRPGSPRLPPALALVVAVLAMSWAGPLIRFATAPALVVSAWRLVFSVALVAGILGARRGVFRGVRLSGKEWALAVGAGVLLAGHFWSWIASIRLTTVASSVVLVSTQPIFVAVLSIAWLGERPSRLEWMGIAVAVLGAMVIGWGDLALGGSALLGDALATGAAVLVAGYYVIGRRLRERLDLWAYVTVVYGVAAGVLTAGVLVAPGVRLTGYPTQDWLVFLALAAGPMMLGHTGVNYALRYHRAYVANLALLGEPVGATFIAWALPAIREVPPLQTFVGGALILAGIAAGTVPAARRRRGAETSSPGAP